MGTTKIDADLMEGMHSGMMLAPVGFMYNRKLRALKSGDMLESSLDGTLAEVSGVAVMRTGLKSTDLLCRARYGTGIMRKMAEWRRDAVLFGNDRSVVNNDECLLIVYRIWKQSK